MSNAPWSATIRKLYRQRWRIWIVASLAHTVSLFHRAAMAPIADRVMADFDITALAFGSLGAVYFYTYAAMQLPSGTLADTLGPRKTVTAGLFLSAAGSIIMGMAPSFSVLYIGRLIVSFGVSVAWLSAVKLVMEWFSTRESGTMIGLTGAIANCGQLAATTPLALLVIWGGWRMSLVAIGQLTLVLAIVNWFIVRDSPSKVGLPPIAKVDGQGIPHDSTSIVGSHPSLVQRLNTVFSNKRLWPLFLLAFGVYGSFATLIQNWAVIYIMQTYGLPRDLAANFVLVAAIGHIVGFPLAGFISDRIKKRRFPSVLFSGILLASFLLWTFWNSGRPPLEALYPLCFLIALGTGAIPIIFATVGDLTGPSYRGTASGLVNCGLFVGPAIAQPLFGYILDMGWEGKMTGDVRIYPLPAFQQGLYLCCAMAALGFLGALLVKETHCRAIYSTQD